MYICNALKEHGYSAFSLSILEYMNITDCSSLDKAKNLILEREQFYIDSLKPEYNILITAGSRLGSRHLAETLSKLSKINSGENNPMYGKTHTPEAKVLISNAKSGENHPNFGKYKKVFIYSFDSKSKGLILYKSFDNSLETIKYFGCSRRTLSLYLDKNRLYKKQWILYTSEQI
jgi:group I intron endonuclease